MYYESNEYRVLYWIYWESLVSIHKQGTMVAGGVSNVFDINARSGRLDIFK